MEDMPHNVSVIFLIYSGIIFPKKILFFLTENMVATSFKFHNCEHNIKIPKGYPKQNPQEKEMKFSLVMQLTFNPNIRERCLICFTFGLCNIIISLLGDSSFFFHSSRVTASMYVSLKGNTFHQISLIPFLLKFFHNTAR